MSRDLERELREIRARQIREDELREAQARLARESQARENMEAFRVRELERAKVERIAPPLLHTLATILWGEEFFYSSAGSSVDPETWSTNACYSWRVGGGKGQGGKWDGNSGNYQLHLGFYAPPEEVAKSYLGSNGLPPGKFTIPSLSLACGLRGIGDQKAELAAEMERFNRGYGYPVVEYNTWIESGGKRRFNLYDDGVAAIDIAMVNEASLKEAMKLAVMAGPARFDNAWRPRR